MMVRRPAVLSSTGSLDLTNSSQPSCSSGGDSTISENSARKYWLMGVYLPVMALKAY
jgi:hypothetical protein